MRNGKPVLYRLAVSIGGVRGVPDFAPIGAKRRRQTAHTGTVYKCAILRMVLGHTLVGFPRRPLIRRCPRHIPLRQEEVL